MPISIAPTNLLPLGDQPTRVSVRINRDLLKLRDPSMEPLVEEDPRFMRKARAAIDQMARDVSMALFGAEVSRLSITFGWPNDVIDPEGPEIKGVIKADYYVGICFDHNIKAEDLSPRVLELTAREELDGTIIFHTAELDAFRGDFINESVNQGTQEGYDRKK